ncbi:MAG TPA: hypothetical protein VJV03_00150, partial [Pyrinomonadaceae bacterium]|nr:hypothetical protein [Pyrinomonadaceae bacterium]
ALDEYEISGIKTTLPFFREIVRDEEFIQGRLDTGFISRFNERRAQNARPVGDTVERDIATIAAALHYARHQRATSQGASSIKDVESRWKMSGRVPVGRFTTRDR